MKPESMVWQSYDSGHRRDPHMSQLFSVSRCSLGFVQDPERGKPTVAYLRSLAQMWSSIYIYYHNEYVQICAHVTHMHTCSVFEASGISLTVSYCGGRGAICINKLDFFIQKQNDAGIQTDTMNIMKPSSASGKILCLRSLYPLCESMLKSNLKKWSLKRKKREKKNLT